MNKVSLSRQSNFELLRIICMLGVITGHALYNLYELHTPNFSIVNTVQILLMNICVVAVNCFVMISGYFRIRQSWKGITGLWMQLLFYATLSFLLCIWLKPEQSLMVGIKRIVFPLSESGLWFIAAYVGLYLIAPLLNSALDYQSRQQKVRTLILLLIVDVYLGYMHQTEEITINGYHLIHFIVLYWLGNCMNEFKSRLESGKWGWAFLLIIIINTALHAVKMVFPPIAIIYSMRYNSPMNLIASVVFFIWAMQWSFQSGMVNKIAKSVLSVYICSEMIPCVFYGVLYHIQGNIPIWLELIFVLSYIVFFFMVIIVFDKLRIIITTPIHERLSRKMEKWMERLLEMKLIKTIFNNNNDNPTENY